MRTRGFGDNRYAGVIGVGPTQLIEVKVKAPGNHGFLWLKGFFFREKCRLKGKVKYHTQTDTLFVAMCGIATQPNITARRAV